jgi:1-deoxy-D-xylulose-5-phosphate reductoisomerase
MVKNIALLGSTGSIGTQTLDVVRKFPDRLSVIALAAGNNTSLLKLQISEFKPRYVYAADREPQRSGYTRPEDMATLPEADIVVIAISGNAALKSVASAVRSGKTVALSNKESLVSAGDIIMQAARRSGAGIRPVDSEHSAIWQCLLGETGRPARLILTASGGPFRNFSPARMAAVTPEQALAHPSWKMGPKVTVDSATLMNKGLEVIEAHHLFGMPYENIEVVVHPQSIVHSLVEFGDGAVKAQLSPPDMRLPIQLALSYPERWQNTDLARLDLVRTTALDFQAPDFERFPCLKLAVDAGRRGGTYPAVMCAADEAAVKMFLKRRIMFTDIPEIIRNVLDEHKPAGAPDLDDIAAAGVWAMAAARNAAEKVRTVC